MTEEETKQSLMEVLASSMIIIHPMIKMEEKHMALRNITIRVSIQWDLNLET